MGLIDDQKKFAQHIGQFICFAFQYGFELTMGEVARTPEQQKIYFDSGRSKTMNSRHLVRLASDFNIFHGGRMLFTDSKRWSEDLAIARVLGDFWESLDGQNVWGGDWNRNNVDDERFRDPYHFERKPS